MQKLCQPFTGVEQCKSQNLQTLQINAVFTNWGVEHKRKMYQPLGALCKGAETIWRSESADITRKRNDD
jgi:hypothetical protein